MTNTTNQIKFRSKDFNIPNSEILKILYKKVSDSIALLDNKDFELYIGESINTKDKMFSSFCICPSDIYAQAEELDKILGFKDGYFTDSVDYFCLDLNLHQLFWYGVEDIKKLLEEKIKDYKESIFYVWDSESKQAQELDIDASIEMQGDDVLMYVEDTQLLFKADNDYMMSQNIYCEDYDIEDKLPIKDAIKYLTKSIEQVKFDSEMGEEEKEDTVQTINDWISDINKYTDTNYYSCFIRDVCQMAVIDQQGNVIEWQIG